MNQPSEITYNEGTFTDALQAHRAWLNDEGGERLSTPWRFVLSDADLSDANLRGAVLRGAVLRGADLSDADLRDADLSDADLSDADLRDADLRGAVLRGAVLRGAVLRDAVLSGAVLRGADLSDADLRGAVLSGAVLPAYHKWTVTWRTDGRITVGCKSKSIAEWDEWFASDEEYETPRNTADFERIEAAYQHAKRMVEIYQKYEAGDGNK